MESVQRSDQRGRSDPDRTIPRTVRCSLSDRDGVGHRRTEERSSLEPEVPSTNSSVRLRTTLLTHDAARWFGPVGKSTVLTLNLLLSCGPCNVDDLTANRGMTPYTIRKHLRRLAKLDLVVCDSDRWRVVTTDEAELARLLDLAAEGSRTDGAGQR
jgi:hypothetical protein